MDRKTFTDSEVIRLAEQFVPVKINAEKDESTARKYKIRSFPTIIFTDPRGRPIAKIRGYLQAKPFAEKMEQIARVHRELPKMQSRFESDPSDLENAGLLAAAYAARGKVGKAKKAIKVVEGTDPQNNNGYLTEAYMAVGDYYAEKDKARDAAEYYLKAAETAKDSTTVADGRLCAAGAYFDACEGIKPGTSTYEGYLDQAQQQLQLLAEVTDLPEDRRENADRLMDAIKEARQKS